MTAKLSTYNPQRAAELWPEAKRLCGEFRFRVGEPSAATDAYRLLPELADQLEAAGREVVSGLERIENLHGDVSKVRDLYEQTAAERDTLRAKLDQQTVEYQRTIELLRADLTTAGNARTEAIDPGGTERFTRTVTCAWCRNRYRSACPSELDRGLQGSHCASSVVQRGDVWFIHCGYGSDEHDMHTYRFVANPPSEPADPVCDECISQRLRIGDIEDTGLESERRPSDFGPRPFGTWGLVHSICKLTEDMVPLRLLAMAADAYVHAGGTAEGSDVTRDLQGAVREYRKYQRWTGEIDDGGEEYVEGCPEVAAQMRDAAAQLEQRARYWEGKRDFLPSCSGEAAPVSVPGAPGLGATGGWRKSPPTRDEVRMHTWWWYCTIADGVACELGVIQLDVVDGEIVDVGDTRDCVTPFDPDDWGEEWAPCTPPPATLTAAVV